MRSGIVRIYLLVRSLIGDTKLKNETLKMMKKFKERIDSTSQDRMEVYPGSEKWNGIEISFHAFNTAKGILRLCDGLRTKQNVADSDKSTAGRTRKVSRDDLMGLIHRVYQMTEEFDYQKVKTEKSGHPFFGKFDFHQWLTINLVHLERHYRQLNRVLS